MFLIIAILCASQSKKILNAQFDKLPLHGLGKELSANWWKALAYQLISHGYLTETIKDTFKFVRVSPKGLQFLSSSKPDSQPTLVLPVTSEMSGDEEHRNRLSEFGELNGLTSLKYEGLSEAEAQLYKMLLEERMKLARAIGTAPYALCGDQTLKKLALTRPSTKARLANIDGVNQHLLTKYGDRFILSIKSLSQRVNLSLDGDATSPQPTVTKPVYTVPKAERKLTPAKFEAWKMWYKDGLSFQKIAKYPGRSTPVKEDTVLGYILDAAQEGCAFDWARFCQEIGLTSDMLANIQAAISKIGSTDKLKPIKNELSEEISYTHIKACLVMQDLGISAKVIPPGHHTNCRADENSDETSELHQRSSHPCHMEGPRKSESPVGNMVGHSFSEKSRGTYFVVDSISTKPPLVCTDDLISSSKRQKVNATEEHSLELEATESSMLKWLKDNDGVSLSDILERFNGSTEESVLEMLNCLEKNISPHLGSCDCGSSNGKIACLSYVVISAAMIGLKLCKQRM
ncbi:DNA helicase [Sarracenia purpurea var. burkii]